MSASKSVKCGAKKSNGHKMDCKCPICKNMSKSKKRGGSDDEVIEDDSINNVVDNVVDDKTENEFIEDVIDSAIENDETTGGKRKNKKRGNGHKMNCGCPICKNMRKSKKQSGGEDEMMDETEVIADTDGDKIVTNVEEEQMGGKKSKRKTRKTRKNKRKSSKRKGRKTKRRTSRK
jgi:hypothetical protein